MKLDVPLIQQREGSNHCQLATLLMVLEYMGDHMEYDELLKELEPYMQEGGMHNQGPAMFMQKRGYKTLFAHHDLGVLTPELENKTEKDLALFEQELAQLPDDENNPRRIYRREKLKLDIEYMKLGGQYSTYLPSFEMVREYLDKGIPVILGAVTFKGLFLKPTITEGNHSIVISGYEGYTYFINDPSPLSPGQYTLSKDRLLHAWYSTGVQTRISWK